MAVQAVHILALVAYNQEAVSAAIDIVIKDAQTRYGSQLNFTYSTLINPSTSCEDFESMVANYVSRHFFNGNLQSANTSLIILATGCSQAEYTVADLARGWYMRESYTLVQNIRFSYIIGSNVIVFKFNICVMQSGIFQS